MKKKILIIGKNSFIGNGLFNYLKKKFFVKKISFKNFDNNVNNYNYIINCSIDKNYITKKYNAKNDIDLKIIKKIKDKRIYYIFLSTRKVYKVGPNLNENSKISPVDNYGKNKLITENKIKKYFNNTIILRISNVIGLKKKIQKVTIQLMLIFF